jgi:hypothetical protein
VTGPIEPAGVERVRALPSVMPLARRREREADDEPGSGSEHPRRRPSEREPSDGDGSTPHIDVVV